MSQPEVWPNGARIAVSTSLMFEAGSQDLRHELGPFPIPQAGDLPVNDLHNLLQIYSLAQFELLITSEFDQLYADAQGRRRMMIVSLHDRLGTRPATINMHDCIRCRVHKMAPTQDVGYT
jgi:hypothetical protein